MSRRDIRYTIRFSEKEWEILEEKLRKRMRGNLNMEQKKEA